jgi:hypothetical protein
LLLAWWISDVIDLGGAKHKEARIVIAKVKMFFINGKNYRGARTFDNKLNLGLLEPSCWMPMLPAKCSNEQIMYIAELTIENFRCFGEADSKSPFEKSLNG